MLDIVFVAILRKSCDLTVSNSTHIGIIVYYKRKTFFLKKYNGKEYVKVHMCMNCITRYTHVIHAIQHKLYSNYLYSICYTNPDQKSETYMYVQIEYFWFSRKEKKTIGFSAWRNSVLQQLEPSLNQHCRLSTFAIVMFIME